MIPDVLATVSPYAWGLAGLMIVALALAVALVRTRQRGERPERERHTAPEDRLTLLAAGIATAVSAQGMWAFFTETLRLPIWLTVGMFAFIEVAMITSAVRARRNMRENYSAGVDAAAVWVLTCASATFATLDVLFHLETKSLAEAPFRAAAPLVAAWLWDRGMAIERRRRTGRGRIHWRITPERILVRLGLAEPSERTAGEVDAMRRLTKVALAADRAADAAPGSRAARRRLRALKRHGRAMLTHTAVASDPAQQAYVMGQLGVMRSIGELPQAAPRPFWDTTADTIPDTPAVISRTLEVSGEVSTRWPDLVLDDDPEPDTDLDTELATLLDTRSVRENDHGDDQAAERERPDEQDNRIAEDWIRRQCRGRSGVGRRPTRDEVKDRYGFSRGWAGLRVQAVQERMSAQGYVFADDGTVYSPTRAAADRATEATGP